MGLARGDRRAGRAPVSGGHRGRLPELQGPDGEPSPQRWLGVSDTVYGGVLYAVKSKADNIYVFGRPPCTPSTAPTW